VLIVTLFGSINIALIWNEVYEPLDAELESRGIFIAKSLANQAISPMLYEDIVSLQKLVDNVHEIDSTIAYAFILNNQGMVLAHTFETKVPSGLILANQPVQPNRLHVQPITDKQKESYLIKDIAVPILEGRIGTVRVGLVEKYIRDKVNQTVMVFFLMVSAFLVFGLLGAYIFARIITERIKKIAGVAETLKLESLENQTHVRVHTRPGLFESLPGYFWTEDELDQLSNKFNEMIDRLEKTYQDLRSAQKNLMQSEKLASVGTLAAGIAHEINNPIAGMQNCIRRLNKNPENIEQNKKYLGMMEEAAERIETVVKGLLNFTRKHELHFEDIDMVSVIENALVLTGYKLEKFRIGFEKEYPPRIPSIKGNKNQLEQVIVNLVINAIDAINERSEQDLSCHKKITIRINTNQEKFILEIEDTGIGIRPENLNQIFDPFFTTKRVGDGTGLGLAVCYNIIKEHGGEVMASSVPEKGSVFKIQLPLSDHSIEKV
jgi:two-component system NtrC family sensor kinase